MKNIRDAGALFVDAMTPIDEALLGFLGFAFVMTVFLLLMFSVHRAIRRRHRFHDYARKHPS
jgi:Na+-transporting methylmalonyl-CoA/oxaloacetate decarboxylase gamma subunit